MTQESTVSSSETSKPAEATRTLVIERVFRHSPEKVWRALTKRTLIAQWLMSNDFESVAGHRFQFRADPVPNWNGIIDCEVLIVEDGRRLSYRWASLGLDSVVLWTLTEAEGGTHLRMEHSGFRSDQDAAYKGANYGWQRFIGNLERVIGGVE